MYIIVFLLRGVVDYNQEITEHIVMLKIMQKLCYLTQYLEGVISCLFVR